MTAAAEVDRLPAEPPRIDQAFAALPLRRLADAALARAADLGASHASVHVIRNRVGRLRMRDAVVQAAGDSIETALGVRLVYDGTWGYAATVELTTDAAARAAAEAVAVAAACRPLRGSTVAVADEDVYPATTWSSPYDIDPFDVTETERAELLGGWSRRLLSSPAVEHVIATLSAVRENRFYADQSGTEATQQRIRVHPMITAFGGARDGSPESLRSAGPPVARGWEYLTGSGWDWEDELARLPVDLAAKSRARLVEPGVHDLLIDASNLWLTIHETVGHATELDRALGHEATYGGTTFLSCDAPGSLRYGSELMNVTADRTARHGLATVGLDDEGVPARAWDVVKDGIFVGFQTDRQTAAVRGEARSTGCSFAESALHTPLPRMPNVSLQPAAAGPDVAGLVAGMEDGIYLAGADSWSIDPRREQFQFTAQLCRRIRSGRLAEHLRGVAYLGSTTQFWGALAALGGERTYTLFGADLCGKGQPLQIAAASHGCPAAVFHGIRVERTDSI